MSNELKINVPEGFEIDKDNSTYDACIELNIHPSSIINLFDTRDEFTKTILAFQKLIIIAKAINQGWTPDWSNFNQRKYYPYFNLSSGFGFGDSLYDCGNAHASVGSRLCFETEEKSTYTGKQFIDIYKDFLK